METALAPCPAAREIDNHDNASVLCNWPAGTCLACGGQTGALLPMHMKPSSITGVPFTRAVLAHSSNSLQTSKADDSRL